LLISALRIKFETPISFENLLRSISLNKDEAYFQKIIKDNEQCFITDIEDLKNEKNNFNNFSVNAIKFIKEEKLIFYCSKKCENLKENEIYINKINRLKYRNNIPHKIKWVALHLHKKEKLNYFKNISFKQLPKDIEVIIIRK